MKKIVSLSAFLLVSLVLVQAQNEIRFGFHVSPSFNWMTTNSNRINASGTNLGLQLGMLGEYFFRENYAFTGGLGFAFNKGGTLLHENGGVYWPDSDLGAAFDTLPSNVKLKYGIQYVEIPIGLKMRTNEFGYLRYYLEPSLMLAFKTQARGTVTGTGIGDQLEQINIRNEVNPFNVAWGIGAGVEYAISESTSLIGGINLQFGFADVTKDNGTEFDDTRGSIDEDSNGKTNNVTIRIGVMF